MRPSPLAGIWYPGDDRTLRQQVCDYMKDANPPKLEGEVVALIAPHAGYRYSGQTAGYAFRCVRDMSPDIVAILSPFHDYHPMPLLTTAYQAYETPLGIIPVAQEAVSALNTYLGEEIGEDLEFIVQEREHAVEIELPFLQCALVSQFHLLPLMCSTNDAALMYRVGEGLANVLKAHSNLLVASTDLSHFYTQAVADKLDQEMLHQIETFSPEGVLRVQQEGSGLACGVMAVVAVMVAARLLGANKAQVLHHSTSGESSGDYNSVVGYGAVALVKS